MRRVAAHNSLALSGVVCFPTVAQPRPSFIRCLFSYFFLFSLSLLKKKSFPLRLTAVACRFASRRCRFVSFRFFFFTSWLFFCRLSAELFSLVTVLLVASINGWARPIGRRAAARVSDMIRLNQTRRKEKKKDRTRRRTRTRTRRVKVLFLVSTAFIWFYQV